MTYNECKLEEILERKGPSLYNKLKELASKAVNLLNQIKANYPEYTDHTANHSERVIEMLNLIIPDDLKERLNVYEIYFLLASAYLHDIGMVLGPPTRSTFERFKETFERKQEELEDVEEEEGLLKLLDYETFKRFKREEKARNPSISDEDILKNFIRMHHHLISELFMRCYYKDLSLNKSEGKIIGKICRGHRNFEPFIDLKEDVLDSELFEDDVYEGKKIHMRLLACLLRIADELDCWKDRAPELLYDIVKSELPPESRVEWQKHMSIQKPFIDYERDPLLLIIKGECEDPEVHRCIKKWERKVEKELIRLYKYIPRDYKLSGKVLPPNRIDVNIKSRGYIAYDIRFRINEKLALEFLSKYVYGEEADEKIVIRELLQNAIDACRRMRELLKKEGITDYKPEIKVELTEDGRLIVEDNGTGMNEFIIRHYLAEVGSCFYQSPEFAAEGLGFSPISRFGIGILSYFMIADRIDIMTKTIEEDDGWFIGMTDMFDYFYVDKLSRQLKRLGDKKEGIKVRQWHGTRIILYLKNEVKERVKLNSLENVKSDEEREEIKKMIFSYLVEVVRYWSRHIEFPIYVKFGELQESIEDIGFKDGFQKWWLNEVMSDEQDELSEIIRQTKEVFGKEFHEIIIDEEGIKGIIVLPLWILISDKPILKSERSLSVGGIRIPEEEPREISIHTKVRRDVTTLADFYRFLNFKLSVLSKISKKLGNYYNNLLNLLVGYSVRVGKRPWWSILFSLLHKIPLANIHLKNIYFDLDLDPNLVNLDLSRNYIIKDDKYELISNRLASIIAREFRKFIKECLPNISKIGKTESAFFRVFLGPDVALHNEFKNIIKEYYKFTVLTKDGYRQINHAELSAYIGKLIIIKDMDELKLKENEFNYYYNVIRNILGDKMVIVDSWGTKEINGIATVIEVVLSRELQKITLKDLLGIQRYKRDIHDILDISFILVRFTKYKTDKIFKPPNFINADHKFVQLLLKERDNMDETTVKNAKMFFDTLIELVGADTLREKETIFERLKSIQEQILSWFVKKGIIDGDIATNYILTKDDFPEYLFKDEGNKLN